MKVYKVRDMVTGLYQRAGSRPTWSKQGKTWKLGPLKTHFQLFAKHSIPVSPMWEVVELELVECDRYPACVYGPEKSKT